MVIASDETPVMSTDKGSLIFEEKGLVLQRDATVALDTDYSMISLFLKFPRPTWKFTGCNINKAKEMKSLFINLTDPTLETNTRLFENLLKSRFQLDNKPADTNRHKRSILGFLGAGLISTAFSAVSDIVISKRISHLQESFNTFADRQKLLNHKNVHIHNAIVHYLHDYNDLVNKHLLNLQCDIDANQMILTIKLLTLEYNSHIQSIFEEIQRGALTSQVTAKVLNETVLSEILRSHSQLSKTLYREESITYFYQAALMTMANVSYDKNNLNIHYIVSIPWLTKHNTFPSYRIKQVGIQQTDTCYKVNLPNIVVKGRMGFFELDMTSCDDRLPIRICYSQPIQHLQTVTCLHHNQGDKCELIKIPCKFEYVFDKSGILIHHLDNILVLNRGGGERPNISSVQPSPFGTSFISWEHASLVQAKQHNFHSPTYITNSFTIPTDTLQWVSHLNMSIEEFGNFDFSGILKTPLDPDSHEEALKRSPFFITIVVIVLILLTLLLLGLIFYYRGIFNKLVLKMKTKNGHVEIPMVEQDNHDHHLPETAGPYILEEST